MSSSSRHGGAHSAVLGQLERALVGDLEVADLLDLVAPELDPQRVLLGRREDVEDAAAHREVAALLDQVGAGVARRDEVGHDVGQLPSGVADLQGHRRQLAETGDLRLQHRPDRRNDHVEWSGRRIVRLGVRQPAQHGQSLPDRVRARREPLVGQRLPAGVDRNPIRVDQAAQGPQRDPRPPGRCS